jgi:hypothetical protein
MSAALLPLDPTRLIPIAGNLLGGIVKLAYTIAKKVQQVQINKIRCGRLSESIQRAVLLLRTKEFMRKLSSYGDALRLTLESFRQFLGECYQFIKSFTDASWLKNFFVVKIIKKNLLIIMGDYKTFELNFIYL